MPKIKVKGQTVQTGERAPTNGRTHGRYQTYYLPCYAVDNDLVSREGKEIGNVRPSGCLSVCLSVCFRSAL